MTNQSLALMVRTPNIDLPGAFQKAQSIRQSEAQTRLSDFKLSEAHNRKRALADYGQSQRDGNKNAIEELSSFPDIQGQIISNRNAMRASERAAYDEKLLQGARDAQRILSIPAGPERENAYRMELQKDLDAGEIDQQQFDQLSSIGAQDSILNQAVMAALPLEKQIALKNKRDPYSTRASAASKYGIDPNSEAGQSFVLTGNLPSRQSSKAPTMKEFPDAEGNLRMHQWDPSSEEWTPVGGIPKGGDAGLFKTPQDRVKHEQAVRKEYTSVVNDFRTVRDATARVEASYKQNSPAGDLSMIFNYMKILDPGSVVRESEFQTAAESGSFGDRIRAAAERIRSGKRLSDDMRKDFLDAGRNLFRRQQRQFQKTEGQYKSMAQRLGLRIEDVVPDYSPVLDDAPQDPNTRDIGSIYNTPRGPAIWRGNGWEPVQ